MPFTLTTENIATLLIDGSTIFLLIGVFSQTSIMRKRGRKDDKLFSLLIFLDILIAIADIVTYLADGKDFAGARLFNMGGVSIFYLALDLLCMVWLHYCIVRFRNDKISGKWTGFLFLPGLIVLVLLVFNTFTGALFFSVDETNTYHYGLLFVPLFLVMGLYVFAGFFLIWRYRSNDAGPLIPVWLYMLPLVAGLVVPFVMGGISLASIGCGMSITFTHLGSVSEIADTEEGGEKI